MVKPVYKKSNFPALQSVVRQLITVHFPFAPFALGKKNILIIVSKMYTAVKQNNKKVVLFCVFRIMVKSQSLNYKIRKISVVLTITVSQ